MKSSNSKNVLPHLKVWLLQGKTITQNQALRLWNTSRLSVYVHRLRRDYSLPIVTEMKSSGSDQYAQYYIPRMKK